MITPEIISYISEIMAIVEGTPRAAGARNAMDRMHRLLQKRWEEYAQNLNNKRPWQYDRLTISEDIVHILDFKAFTSKQVADIILKHGHAFRWDNDCIAIFMERLPGGRQFRTANYSASWEENVRLRMECIPTASMVTLTQEQIIRQAPLRSLREYAILARTVNSFGFQMTIAKGDDMGFLPGSLAEKRTDISFYFEDKDDAVFFKLEYS